MLSSSFVSPRKDRGAILSLEALLQGENLRPLPAHPYYLTWLMKQQEGDTVSLKKYRNFIIRGEKTDQEVGCLQVRQLRQGIRLPADGL